jgi:hypothetical protein
VSKNISLLQIVKQFEVSDQFRNRAFSRSITQSANSWDNTGALLSENPQGWGKTKTIIQSMVHGFL